MQELQPDSPKSDQESTSKLAITVEPSLNLPLANRLMLLLVLMFFLLFAISIVAVFKHELYENLENKGSIVLIILIAHMAIVLVARKFSFNNLVGGVIFILLLGTIVQPLLFLATYANISSIVLAMAILLGSMVGHLLCLRYSFNPEDHFSLLFGNK